MLQAKMMPLLMMVRVDFVDCTAHEKSNTFIGILSIESGGRGKLDISKMIST